MFKKLFQSIFSNHSYKIKFIYNKGVRELARNNISYAINIFESISDKHESAAFNLGLIYLDGAGKFVPNYKLSRKYFQLADNLGHPRAKPTALIIGLDKDPKFTLQDYAMLLPFAVNQYVLGGQLGNLAYLIAYDIIHHILKTSTNEIYGLSRFLDYEIYCIRNFANQEVTDFYHTSSLTDYELVYQDDWENGETAALSDYLNEKMTPTIIALSHGKLKLFEMGTLRLAAVNTVYKYYYE
ncbi:hypothetical protein ACOR62_00050 [Neisseria lisongii]|uniref:Sel1 repeat family protein n=1 Tax=Neisseria lisongii TaxID=2912188 RepID=A0AAW5AL51_9NEIS|nr:hypothetical protein [Neisseria lisongii]MCF7530587.1 hypothetical protein [Neisseria lisongii]